MSTDFPPFFQLTCLPHPSTHLFPHLQSVLQSPDVSQAGPYSQSALHQSDRLFMVPGVPSGHQSACLSTFGPLPGLLFSNFDISSKCKVITQTKVFWLPLLSIGLPFKKSETKEELEIENKENVSNKILRNINSHFKKNKDFFFFFLIKLHSKGTSGWSNDSNFL